MKKLDALDYKILAELQEDASQPFDQLAKKIGSSKTPVWNRIKKMKASGIISKTVAVLDADKLELEACFFVLVRTSSHEEGWQARFLNAIKKRPEVLEAHRLAGEIDYLLKVRVQNAKQYDRFYQGLIGEVNIYNVTALLSMEEIKSTTALPIELKNDHTN